MERTDRHRHRSQRGAAAISTIAVLVVWGALLSGCGGTVRPPVSTELVPFNSEERLLREQATAARYRLRPGDHFRLDFKYEDDLDQSDVLILPDGYITLAGMRPLPAAGLTVSQLDSLLVAEFGRDYVNPDLSVIVTQLSDQKVYVLGEVMHAGMFSIPADGAGVVQAISLAGGFKNHAKRDQVVVVRVTDQGFLYRTCNLNHLERIGVQELDFFDLQPYDVVYVPRSNIGDLASFSESVLTSVLRVSSLFWDVYAITHMNKVDRIIR